MPTRQNGSEEQAERRTPRRVANTAPTGNQNARNNSQKVDEDDAWDEIMNMKGKGEGGDGGFNKMNTNFFLKDGEEIDIVVLDENPVIFWGHVIKCESEKGQTFYRTEQCQKSEQDYCVLCESDNPSVSKAKNIIAFRVLDSRGSWDKNLNNGKGGLDGVPAPKIFLTPLYLAKQFKSLKDDAGGSISDKVVKLSKNTNYQANFKFKKNADGSLRYVDAPEFDGDLPDTLEVYAPMSDNELMDFVQKFAVSARASAPSNSRGGGRKSGGSFGD